MCRKGITFLEVLGVIIIIALLAVILYPVRTGGPSSKRSPTLSAIKQVALAELMYQEDSNDHYVLLVAGSFSSLQNRSGAGDTDLPNGISFTEALHPYVKNNGVFVDTTRGDVDKIWTGPPTPTGLTSYRNQGRFPMFGYNYVFLSPNKIGADPMNPCDKFESVPGSRAKNPSGTIMFIESKVGNVLESRGWLAVNPPGMSLNLRRSIKYCISYVDDPATGASDLGGDLDWSQNFKPDPSTGQAYTKRGIGAIASYVDGHAKYLSIAQLTAGTNYATAPPPDLTGINTTILDKSKYIWNLDNNFYEDPKTL